MTTLRKAMPFTLLCAALLVTCLPLAAQNNPDCSFTFNFTGDATMTGRSNLSGNTPCVNWRVTFSTTATLTTSVTFETSPDDVTYTAVPNTICSATVQPPCLFQGTNPTAPGAQGMIYASLYGNYVRVTTSGSAGAGTGTVRAYGAKGATASGPAIPGTIINGAQLVYYLTPTASDIATYLQATPPPFSPKTTETYAALPAGTNTLQNWSTNAGIPNLTFIPAGAYLFHVHANRTGSAGTVILFAQFWEVSATGVDIAQIGQTENTIPLGTVENEYTLAFADGNVYTLASAASRIVARVFAVVVGGTGPTARIFVGGTADSHLALPSNTVDASNFVPYVGAMADLDLGTHNEFIGTTKLTSGQQIDVLCAGDVTTALQSAITALDALNGGVLRLSVGSCFDTAQLSRSSSNSLSIIGNGAGASGIWNTAPTGGTQLDLRYAGGPKITTTGAGRLTLRNLNLLDTTDGTQDFIHTTNTTLDIQQTAFWGKNNAVGSHIVPTQNAIVLGGTTTPTAFQGYGTIIANNWFSGISAGIVNQQYGNSVIIENNTWTPNCGGPSAIITHGYSASTNGGLTVIGNLIEVPYYNVAIALTSNVNSNFISNSFWDQTAGVPITAASNANPVVLTSPQQAVPTGASVTISGATVNCTALNGTFTSTFISPTTFSIPVDGTTCAGTLTGTVLYSITMNYYSADSASTSNTFIAAVGPYLGPLVSGAGAASNIVLDNRAGGGISFFPSLSLPNMVVGSASNNNSFVKLFSTGSPTNANEVCFFQNGSSEVNIGQNGTEIDFAISPAGSACVHTAAQMTAASPFRVSGTQVVVGTVGGTIHNTTLGAAPSITAGGSVCGVGASISTSSNDIDGQVTLGTVPGTCIITFGAAYAATPKCNVTFEGGIAGAYTPSTATLSIAATGLSGAFDYRCTR